LAWSVDGEEAKAADVEAEEVVVGVAKELSGSFRCSVRGDGFEDGVVFAEGNVRAVSVDGGGGAEDEVSDPCVAARFKQHLGSVDVDLFVEGGIFDGGADAGTGS